ncbi:MAG: Fic family protein [SAR202 cluster bacterium]|nr:Fic family protein [SAR202 cluster bacterium]
MQKNLERSPIGELVQIDGKRRAYVPGPLPRSIDLDGALVYALDEASRAISLLAGAGETFHNPDLLIRPFLSREAILSSRIEGTQSTLEDLFEYEASRRDRGDVMEVFNYVLALNKGLQMIRDAPINLWLVNSIHSTLMHDVRGRNKRPGQLRNEQVYIGGEGQSIDQARFIPPPPYFVQEALEDCVKFANERNHLPPLVQCAMMHYQFETIHPYSDGNGRMGRLLIVLFLCARGVLTTPLLYLSAYFERDRQAYYDHLLRLSETGDWQRWLRYFLKGVTEESRDALQRIRHVRDLHDSYKRLLLEKNESGNALHLLDEFFAQPVMTAPSAARIIGITAKGAQRILERMTALGIVKIEESRPRLYVAHELMDILQAPRALPPAMSRI